MVSIYYKILYFTKNSSLKYPTDCYFEEYFQINGINIIAFKLNVQQVDKLLDGQWF